MNGLIKRAAIPLSGYVYQNLVGLNLLCDWLDDPTLYQWVQFEADDRDIAQGLDDIVALCHDYTFVLRQVKFTVNPDDSSNALNWDWLLEHKPNGRSNLQKWANAWSSLPPERVRDASVITNRRPDREFASCLDASSQRVDLGGLPADLRTRIIEQLEGEHQAFQFFAAFKFEHSYQGFTALQRTLIDRFVPRHTDRHGWLALSNEAIYWALRKNVPPPEGKITLDILRGTIDQRRPEPLEQSFRIPSGYRPPDEQFSKQFIADICASNHSAIVLWGAPGQGKSTFISYVCNVLGAQDVPYIRHHYFLSLQDTSDRLTLWRVADSLMAQMEQQHVEHVQGSQNGSEYLREWIVRCANGYREAGKPFVVVIDGLDHVWRENDHNKGPLDSLFSMLLPVPDNVVLLIGTQRISSEQLPKNFNRHVRENNWVQFPRMSLVSIKAWLDGLHQAKQFDLPDQGRREDDVLADLAMAFERVSNGHPLVLTYIFNALARGHRVLNAYLVENESPPLSGDVTDYYRILWERLSHNAKDALHLAADAGFIWPTLGLETCLGVSADELYPEIGHLFYRTEAGQVPFHGSLYVFIQAEKEHSSRVAALLFAVVNWLETKATPFHRWGWLWLYKARAGDPGGLLSGANRQWVIDSLARAYPQEQIEQILTAAERIAFEAGDYSSAIRHRWLKTRVLNGPEFQLDDYNRLYRWALQLSDDDYPLNLLASDLQGASVTNFSLLGMQYLAAGRVDDAKNCQELMRQRINDRIDAGAYSHSELQAVIERHLEMVAGTRQFNAERVADNIRRMTGATAASTFSQFLRDLSRHEDLDLLMMFATVPMNLGMRRELEIACIRLAGYLGVNLQDWPAFRRFRKHPLSFLWRILYARDQYTESAFRLYREDFDLERSQPDGVEVARHLHALFFHAVTCCVAAGGRPQTVVAPQYHHRAWLSVATAQLLKIADAVGALLSRGDTPSFVLPFRFCNSFAAPKDFDARSEYLDFQTALITISADLFLVVRGRSSLAVIPSNDWSRAMESPHFLMHPVRDRYFAAGLNIVAADVIESDIRKSLREISDSVSRLNERTESYVNQCELAIQYDLHPLAKELLLRALGCVIGYGWRKDPSLSYVLRVIESMIPIEPDFARQMVCRVAPIFNRIDALTEDDGVRESDLADALLQLMPESYVAYYRHWLKRAEWYSAELVFARLMALHDLNMPGMSLATAAVWSSREVGELRERAHADDRNAAAIINANASRFGQENDELGRERVQSSGDEKKDFKFDVQKFPPGSFQLLLAELNAQHAYTVEREVVREWFSHWVEKQQGISLLRDLEQFLSAEDVPSAATELLDLAFSLSLELEGKRQAYKWLVAAQISRRGWDRFYGRDDAKQRFTLFAEHYRNQWREFIIETTKPSTSWRGTRELTIPHDRLVDFLIAVQEYSRAKEVVIAMVDATVEDFSDISLEVPEWLTASF